MATTIENFLLRFKTEGADKINTARDGVRGLSDDVIAANANLGALSGTFSRVIGGLGTVGLAVTALGVGLGAGAMAAINLADELQDLADATGLSASAILSFKQSVIASGGDADDYQKIIAKLNQSINDSAAGNEASQDAFRKLGVVVRDAGGTVRSTSDILNDIIYKLQDGGASADEMSSAIDIMGKVMARLNPANLQATADAVQDADVKRLAEYKSEIESLQATLSQITISFFGSLAEQINNATSAYKNFKRSLGDLPESELNPLGQTRKRNPGFLGALNATPEGNLPFGQTRAMTGTELSAYTKQQAEARARADEEKRLREESAKGGDFGAVSKAKQEAAAAKAKAQAEAAARALASSQDRIEQSRLAARFDSLRQNLDDLEALELDRAEALARAKLQIQNQENLSTAQKAMELGAKTEEINADFDKRIREYNKRQADKQQQEELKRIETINRAREQATSIVAEAQKQNQMANDRFALEQKVLGMRELDRQYTIDQNNLLQEQKNQLEAIRALKELPDDQRLAREREITAEYEKQKAKLEEQRLARMATQNNPQAGAQSVVAKMMDATSPFQVAADQTQALFDGMNRALDDFVTTGKFKFGDFARSIILDLIKIQVRAQATQVLSAVLGSFGLSPTIPGRATGGPVSAGSPYIIGEKGPELFMPRQSGTIIPNGQLSAMGSNGGSQLVTYNIQAVDALSFRQMLARDPEFLYNLTEQTRRGIPSRRRQ